MNQTSHNTSLESAKVGTNERGYLEVGGVMIDLTEKSIRGKGVVVRLRPMCIRILTYLACNMDKVVTRDMIIRDLYEDRKPPNGPKIIHVYMCYIRKDLRRVSDFVRIDTVWGNGYQLVVRTACED
jgi:two-component system response regulator RegX3